MPRADANAHYQLDQPICPIIQDFREVNGPAGLAAAGDPAGALTAFDEYRDRLATETGQEPTPQAREIRQHMLVGQQETDQPDPRHAAWPARPHGSPSAAGTPSLAARTSAC
ncbi:MAG: hypothetical protein ACRDS0_40205 [Pseudonocardiaceae bacterium]